MGQDILKIISSNASIFVLEAAVMNQIIKVFLGCDMKVVSSMVFSICGSSTELLIAHSIQFGYIISVAF